MDPSQLITPLEILSCLSFVPKVSISQAKLPMHYFDKTYQQVDKWFPFKTLFSAQHISFLDPKYTANLFRKYVIFGPFARAKYVIFGPKIHCQSVQNKLSFVIELDLNQPKGFFSKKFQERLNWQRINLKQITNICFFMFGWKTNQWNPASEWNDFASQASKKVLL